MLREGWDVQNVTVVVGLRPTQRRRTSLPEQTIDRGTACRIPTIQCGRTWPLHRPFFRRGQHAMSLGFYFTPSSFTAAEYDEAVSQLEATGGSSGAGRSAVSRCS